MTNIEHQHKVIMDWADHRPGFCVHDFDFWDYWRSAGGGSEKTLRRRLNELVKTGELQRTRTHVEPTAPSAIPRWFFVYWRPSC